LSLIVLTGNDVAKPDWFKQKFEKNYVTLSYDSLSIVNDAPGYASVIEC